MPKLIDKDENELLNLQMSTDEHWTGKYWIDGKRFMKNHYVDRIERWSKHNQSFNQ